MKKRIVFIMISIILLANFNTISVHCSENNQYNDILNSFVPSDIMDESAKISRGDCVATIMKLIGVDEDSAYQYSNNMDFYIPVFDDLRYDSKNDGYIIIAKFSDVAMGVSDPDFDGITNFEQDRDVTVKECLTFMLRCLQDSDCVKWDNIMVDSVKVGLLQNDELELYVDNEPLSNKQFYTLLQRMLNQKRYLYWPIEETEDGYAKTMKTDDTNSIRYIDWILEK